VQRGSSPGVCGLGTQSYIGSGCCCWRHKTTLERLLPVLVWPVLYSPLDLVQLGREIWSCCISDSSCGGSWLVQEQSGLLLLMAQGLCACLVRLVILAFRRYGFLIGLNDRREQVEVLIHRGDSNSISYWLLGRYASPRSLFHLLHHLQSLQGDSCNILRLCRTLSFISINDFFKMLAQCLVCFWVFLFRRYLIGLEVPRTQSWNAFHIDSRCWVLIRLFQK
jgi:hypothetical protein